MKSSVFMQLISQSAAIFALILAVSIAPLGARAVAGPDVITIYTATSLAEAVRVVIDRHQRGGHARIELIVAQSVNSANAIERHAPVNIFISASEPLVRALIAKGLVEREVTASPIGNNLVLVAPIDSPIQSLSISEELDFNPLLGPNGSLAVGDPDYTPIGIYAMAALSKLGRWNALVPRLLRAASARAALEMVENGQATLGITLATSAAASRKVKVLGQFPRNDSIRIRYTFAIVKENDSSETRELFRFLIGSEAMQIYGSHGFTVENPSQTQKFQ